MLTLTKAAGILLLPPGVVIVLAVAGLLLLPRRRLYGGAILAFAVATLYALSLPATGVALLGGLEREAAALPETDGLSLRERADAIVVLGGGRHVDAPEYGGDTVNAMTLERLRYGARLHSITQLPVLVSGGSVFGEALPEATLMQRALERDFRTPVAWAETRSRTTYENAVYSRAILEAAGIRRVLLVTHAWHMPRAAWAFERAGIQVVPAPTGFSRLSRHGTALEWLPTARGLGASSLALHERLGLTWYRWRHAHDAVK